MAVGDIYEVTDVQVMYGQQVLNVYFYEQTVILIPGTDDPNIAGILATQWYLEIMPTILAGQTADVVHTSVRSRNLFDDSEAYEFLCSNPGVYGPADADSESSFDALGIKMTSTNAAIRPAGKRIAGIIQSAALDGVITDSSYLLAAANIASTMTDNVTNGTLVPVDTWRPVVVERIAYEVAGRTRYRLPNVIGEKVIGYLVSALFNAVLTSQVSRKVGRGA
jgi:hypothetical protein